MENFENPRIDGGNVSEDRAQYMVGEPEAENTKTNEKSKLAIDIYEEGVAGRHKIKDWKKYFTKEQIKRFGHDFLESWYNQFRSLKIMQEAISQETGKPIKDFVSYRSKNQKDAFSFFTFAP